MFNRILFLILTAVLFPFPAFCFDISADYAESGVVLANKTESSKVCGLKSKVLSVEKSVGDYKIVNCKPPSSRFETMKVVHLLGLPVQVSIKYSKNAELGKNTSLTNTVNTITTGDNLDKKINLRIITGITSDDVLKKVDFLNAAGFILMIDDDKLDLLTITTCTNTWAEENMKGLHQACIVGRAKLK